MLWTPPNEIEITAQEYHEFIESLSDEEIDEFYRAFQLYGRMKDDIPLSVFSPIPKLQSFRESDAFIRWIFGGNMTGKTYHACEQMACEIMELDHSHSTPPTRTITINGIAYEMPRYGKVPLWPDEPKLLWFGGVNKPKVKLLYQLLLRKMLPKGFETRYDGVYDTVTFDNGNVLQLKSYDQTIEAWQSDAVAGIQLDEQCPYQHFQEVKSRVNRRYGRIWAAMTPIYGHALWTYFEITQKAATNPGIRYWEVDINDNIYLPLEIRQRQIQAYEGTEQEAGRLHGKHYFLEGLIHPAFGDQHIIEPFAITDKYKREYQFARICDIHPRNVNVCMWFMFRDRHDPIVYLIRELNMPGGDSNMFGLRVNQMTDEMGIISDIDVVDHPFTMDTREMNGAKALKLYHGIVDMGHDRDHSAGLSALNEYLRMGKFLVFNTCAESIYSIKYHMWDDYKIGEQEKKDSKEKWIHKKDHHVRNAHYMVLKMPVLNESRQLIEDKKRAEMKPGYDPYQHRNRSVRARV